MSRETLEWLQVNTLIGFTEKRGKAWHYREALQGDEPNHYEGPVPVDDVKRRLFDFEVLKEPVFIRASDGTYTEVSGRKALVAQDSRDVFGVFTDGYEEHQYHEWLVDNVENILDDDLAIGSAGLLRNRAQAWVSVEVPENIETPEGVVFRPNLVAATSFDGSLATTYKRTVTIVVCDNTLGAGLGEHGQEFRIKHTRNSRLAIVSAREALAVVHSIGDDFAAEVKRLTEWEVPKPVWQKHLDLLVPVTDAQGDPLKGRGLTLAENKRDRLTALYNKDHRVAPWNGTAFGVLQAHNTYLHHDATVRGASRVQRNQENALSGRTEAQDAEVLKVLATVSA